MSRCIYNYSKIIESLEEDFLKILLEEDEYMGKGSGYTLNKIDGLILIVHRYTSLGGSSYIPLPENIKKRQAVINVQNNDQRCFMYSILSKFVKSDNSQRSTRDYEEIENKFDFSGLTYPVPLKDSNI